jgi:hypothetical protein
MLKAPHDIFSLAEVFVSLALSFLDRSALNFAKFPVQKRVCERDGAELDGDSSRKVVEAVEGVTR